MAKSCPQCRYELNHNPGVKIVWYKFIGHNAKHPSQEICTYFHAVFKKKLSCSQRLLDFPEDFNVYDFLVQQSDVLPFDNQIHVSHWNLVYAVPGDDPTFSILDHLLYMNDIPSHVLENLQIHAVHASQHPEYYMPRNFPTKVLQVLDTTLSDSMQIHYRFLGHLPQQIDCDFDKYFQTVVKTRSLDRFASFTVFEFLHQQAQELQIDNQIHISHWNLVHVSALKYPQGQQIYKIFDHHFEMKDIPQHIFRNIEIHAIDVTRCSEFYLQNLISKQNHNYLYSQTPETIQHTKIVHNPESLGNGAYYEEQKGGHGLFNSTGATYDKQGHYTGLKFGKYIQENPFICRKM
jgi:hypothetical protein